MKIHLFVLVSEYKVWWKDNSIRNYTGLSLRSTLDNCSDDILQPSFNDIWLRSVIDQKSHFKFTYKVFLQVLVCVIQSWKKKWKEKKRKSYT